MHVACRRAYQAAYRRQSETYRAAHRRAALAYQRRHKRAGLCVRCPRPASDGTQLCRLPLRGSRRRTQKLYGHHPWQRGRQGRPPAEEARTRQTRFQLYTRLKRYHIDPTQL